MNIAGWLGCKILKNWLGGSTKGRFFANFDCSGQTLTRKSNVTIARCLGQSFFEIWLTSGSKGPFC